VPAYALYSSTEVLGVRPERIWLGCRRLLWLRLEGGVYSLRRAGLDHAARA
jgi:hypothetical protein